MQQTELIEILPELKIKVECFKLFGTAMPDQEQIKKLEDIQKCREYNLKLKAEHEARQEYWKRVQESRTYNLKMLELERQQKQETQEIVLLKLVKNNKDILSSVR